MNIKLRAILNELGVLPCDKYYKSENDYEDTLNDIQDAIVRKLEELVSDVESENKDRIIKWEDR